jgi:hypothetical protein
MTTNAVRINGATESKNHMLPILLLCTGTLVVIANQVVSNQVCRQSSRLRRQLLCAFAKAVAGMMMQQ